MLKQLEILSPKIIITLGEFPTRALLDFKFKNNRNYPIKIVAGVANGGVHVSIYGLKTPDDYQVEIFSNYIGSGTYQTYKRLIKDGQVISTELISTDTYHGKH